MNGAFIENAKFAPRLAGQAVKPSASYLRKIRTRNIARIWANSRYQKRTQLLNAIGITDFYTVNTMVRMAYQELDALTRLTLETNGRS